MNLACKMQMCGRQNVNRHYLAQRDRVGGMVLHSFTTIRQPFSVFHNAECIFCFLSRTKKRRERDTRPMRLKQQCIIVIKWESGAAGSRSTPLQCDFFHYFLATINWARIAWNVFSLRVCVCVWMVECAVDCRDCRGGADEAPQMTHRNLE